MALNPHLLESMNRRAGGHASQIIASERPCDGCGYILRGLSLGSNCPECGLPITVPTHEKVDDPLSLMPLSVIWRLTRGCWLASSVIVVGVGMYGWQRAYGFSNAVAAALPIALAMSWIISVLVLTPAFDSRQARHYGFHGRSKMRSVARWGQLPWLLTAIGGSILGAAGNLSGGMQGSLVGLMIIGAVGGIIGFLALCLLLIELAKWTRDDTAELAFNVAMWGLPLVAFFAFIPLSSIFGAGIRFTFAGRGGIVLIAGILVFLAVVFAFPIGLLMVSRSVTLSIAHAIEHKARLHRKARRDREYYDRVGRDIAAMDAPASTPGGGKSNEAGVLER